MKRAVMTVLGVVVLLSGPSSWASSSRSDVQRSDYVGAGGISQVLYTDGGVNTTNVGSGGFVPAPHSRRVSVRIADRSGGPVLFGVSETFTSGQEADLGEFCARTPHPLRLGRRVTAVSVSVLVGVCGSSLSVPTAGEIVATFRT